MGVYTDILDNRNKPKRGLVDEAGSYSKSLSKETLAKRRKTFFNSLPDFKKRNQRKWEKANPKLKFYDLNKSTQDSIRNTGRTDLGTLGRKKATKIGGDKARLKNLEQRSQINNWLKDWLDNNFENYEVRDKDKFLKDLKKDWKKAKKTEFKNNRLAQTGDLPTPAAKFQSVGSGKNKRLVPNKNSFSMFNESLLQSSEVEKDRFYRRLFYGGQIDTNPELKKDINNYFKTVLIDKRRSIGLTQSKIDELNKFLGKNSDVAFILGTDTGLENQMKRKIFGNRFKDYGAYREKISKASLKYMENVKKLEKITGIPIRNEISKEQRLLKKILNVDELPLELRYSIDHLYGISEAVRNPKDKVFARQVAENLIGGTFRQNAAAGLEGYSVRRKALINNIEKGKNVTKSLARLNELTTETYPQFKNLKQPYKIVDGKLTFAKGFKGQTQPERFESYFREIYKTPQGKKIIQQQAGGLKQIIAKLSPNPTCAVRLKKSEGGGVSGLDECFEEGMQALKEKNINKPHQVQGAKQLMNAGKRIGASTFARRLLDLGILGEVAFIAGDTGIRMAMGRPFSEAFKAATFREGQADRERQQRAGFTEREMLIGDAQDLSNKALSLQQQIAAAEAVGDDPSVIRGLETSLKNVNEQLQKTIDPAGTKLQTLLTPTSATNIEATRKLENIMDADRAKSIYSGAELRDQQMGIPGIADYTETETPTMKAPTPEREVLPGTQEYLRGFMRQSLPDSEKIEDRIIDRFVEQLSPMEKFELEVLDPRRSEILYGTQGKFAEGGLTNLTRTIPPESGPNAKGLESLRKYATKRY